MAEEVISTMRTAHAFGTQKTLAGLYDVHTEKARRSDLKAAIWQGTGISVFFFVIYSSYALGACMYFKNSYLLIGDGHSVFLWHHTHS